MGFKPGVFDVNAERVSTNQAVQKIKETETRLLCFVVYGQNPNSGTVNMSGATALAKAIKEEVITTPICFVGSHVSALPYEVLKNESCVDLVLCNEGVYALWNLLKIIRINPVALSKVNGIGYRDFDSVKLTDPEVVVPQDRLDIDLPGFAWDL